jgi:hypothetical protein
VALSLSVVIFFLPISLLAEPDSASFFESYFQTKNGDIPQSYSTLVEELDAYLNPGDPRPISSQNGPAGFDFGYSRAPERDFVSTDKPRKLRSFPKRSDFGDIQAVFTGYVPAQNEIQVISWNPERHEFDFLEVKNYGNSQKPSLQKADRTFCLSCHQNGGPILSRFPWSESREQVGALMLKSKELYLARILREKFKSKFDSELPQNFEAELVKIPVTDVNEKIFEKALLIVLNEDTAPNLDEFKKMLKEDLENPPRTADQNPIFGSPLESVLGFTISRDDHIVANDLSFDGNVRRANRQLQMVRIITQGCGDNIDCRLALITLAAISAKRSNNDDYNSFADKVSDLLKPLWPEDDYSYISSIIPDRDPLSSPERGGRVSSFSLVNPKEFFNPDEFKESNNLRVNTSMHKLDHEAGVLYNYIDFESITDFRKNSLFEEHQSFGIKGIGNPATPRPKQSRIPKDLVGRLLLDHHRLPDIFGLKNLEALQKQYTVEGLAKHINDDPRMRQLVTQAWPPPPEILSQLVIEAVSETNRDETKIFCLPKASPAADLSATLKDVEEHFSSIKPEDLFGNYCSQCHTAEAKKAKVLPLTNLSELKTYLSSEGESAADRLKEGSMPPLRAKKQPTDAERKLMIYLLEIKGLEAPQK